MANITIWPSQPLDGDQWERNTWDIGTPITKEKLENLEEGIAVLATQMEALLREIEIDPSTIILNGTRLDTIQKWITAAEDGNYSEFNTKGSIAARLNNIESVNTTQTNDIGTLKTRATNLEAKTTSITTEIWGTDTTSGTSRIDKNDNKIAAIAAELGGTAPDGSSTTYGGTTRLDSVITKASSIATEIWGSDTTSGDSRIDKLTTELYGNNNTSRLDDLEKELCGATITRDTTNGGYLNSRIDNIESVNSAQSTDISSLKTRATAIETVNTNQNTEIANLKTRVTDTESVNTTQNSRLTALENELSGSGTGTSGSSRLDNLQTWIAGGSTSTYTGTAISTRLNSMQTWITGTASGNYNKNSIGERLDSLESSRTTDENTIGKLETEILGPNKDYSNSRIDQLDTGLSTTNSTVLSHESRISRIETGAVAAKILNYTTTNTSTSDSLILPTDSLLDKNSIIMIFLNAATLGTNNLTIKDSAGTYNIKVNNQANSNLKAKFAAGSLLGLYRGDTNDIYMFNAPLAI